MRYFPSLIVAPPAVIYEVCERQTGVSEATLKSKTRTARLAAMRVVVAQALFELAGFSISEIAKEMCRDHSSIYYQLHHRMKRRPTLGQQYEMLKSEVEQVTKAARLARNIALTVPEDVTESGT